uniref:Uncharacterized protein n=1 Tax=Solanum tuberosum TaxID=4113 RepID=M1DV46_SOLTU
MECGLTNGPSCTTVVRRQKPNFWGPDLWTVDHRPWTAQWSVDRTVGLYFLSDVGGDKPQTTPMVRGSIHRPWVASIGWHLQLLKNVVLPLLKSGVLDSYGRSILWFWCGAGLLK